MKEEIEIWNEVMKDDLNKSIYNVGFQEGRQSKLKEELEFLNKLIQEMMLNCIRYDGDDLTSSYILVCKRKEIIEKELAGGKE